MRFTSIQGYGGAVVTDRGLLPLSVLDLAVPTDDLFGLVGTGLPDTIRSTISSGIERAGSDVFLPVDTPRIAPYRRPRKIFGIGLNYMDHASDLAEQWPTEPASFIKGDHTIADPSGPIVIPKQSQRVTAEGELGLVIGRECRNVSEEEALDYVGALCCILDQTAEDILARNPRFLTRAKNFPTFFVFGPELVTVDEVLEGLTGLDELQVETLHNGASHRTNTVSNMAFSPEYLVSFHSEVMPLYPGDIISTGTPGAAVIAAGDRVGARVQNIGELETPVVDGEK